VLVSGIEIDAQGDRLAIANAEQQEPELGEGDELPPDGFDPGGED
jgi:hypothetical protein